MKQPYTSIILFLVIAITLIHAPGPGKAAFAEPSPSRTTAEEHKTDIQLLTLARAKQISLENSPSLVSALERVSQAREVVNQAKAEYFPTISMDAGMNYNEKTENSNTGYDETSYTSQVSATQVLFNGFYRKYSTLSAQYKEKMSRAAQDDAKRLLSWSVAQAFLNTQLALENIKTAKADMAFNQDQEIEAAAKEKAGSGSYSDVLNFKTKVNTARSSLLSIEQDFNEAIHGLAALMGYKNACLPEGMMISELTPEPPDSRLPGKTDTGKINTGSDTQINGPVMTDQQIKDLVFNRPDIKEAFLSVQDAQADIEIAKSAYFPTISLTGAYGTTSGDDVFDTDTMGASLGVYVSFDIFSGGSTKSKVRQALAEKRESESTLTEAETTAVSNIKTSIQKIATAQQQLGLQTENTRLIEITRDLVQKEFNAGQASLVRLNEAQTDLVTAQWNLSSARVSLILALEEFDYYIGNNINPV